MLVSEKPAPVATPVTVAVTVYVPAVVLAVAVTCVWPEALVTAAADVEADAPEPGAVYVTVAPGTVLPYWSFTTTMSAAASAVPTVALWPEPLTTAMLAGAPALLVSAKVAPVATPATVAVTLYVPMVVLAVAVTCVWPAALVTAAAEVEADAPEPGAVYVTVAPGTVLPYWSLTTTRSGAASAVPTVALCPEPLTTAMLAGVPAVLVSAKVAPVATPATVAVTLYVPVVVFAVAVTCVWPEALVAAAAVVEADAPEAGAVYVTVAPGMLLPYWSFTTTTSGAAKAPATTWLCGVPLTTAMLAAAPAVLVSAKVTPVPTPVTVAVTLYVPVTVFAVAVTCVWPAALVTAAAEVEADAPDPGAVNVTVAPGTVLPYWSFTTTRSGAPSAVPTVALCPEPLTTAMLAGTPAVLVSTKVAGVAMPATDAVTL